MTVTVNGIAVEVSRWPNPGVATVRELLRQRATAVGMLASDTKDDGLIGAAIERLLADEVARLDWHAHEALFVDTRRMELARVVAPAR